MRKKDNKILQQLIFTTGIVPVVITVTGIDRKFNLQLDDLPSSNQQVRHLGQLNNQAIIGTASVSGALSSQIISLGGLDEREY